MSKATRPRFVLCIRPGASEDLEPRKVYQTIPEPRAAKEGYIRIIDESGEDYLYHAEYFARTKPPNHIVRERRSPRADRGPRPESR